MKRRRDATPEPVVDLDVPRQLRRKAHRETPGKVKPRGRNKRPAIAKQPGPNEAVQPIPTTEKSPHEEDASNGVAKTGLRTYGRQTSKTNNVQGNSPKKVVERIPASEGPPSSLLPLFESRVASLTGTTSASSATLVDKAGPPSTIIAASSMPQLPPLAAVYRECPNQSLMSAADLDNMRSITADTSATSTSQTRFRKRPQPRPAHRLSGLMLSPDSDQGFNTYKTRKARRRASQSSESQGSSGFEKSMAPPEVPEPQTCEGEGADDEGQGRFEEVADYEYTFPDGGHSRYFGIPPYPGDVCEADRNTKWKNADDVWSDLPFGHCAPRRAPGDAAEAETAALTKANIREGKHRRVHTSEPGDDEEEQRSTTPSSSNFSDDRRVKEKGRQRRRDRGKPVSDTEAEDNQDDWDLRDSVAPDSLPLTQPELSRRRVLRRTPSSPTLRRENRGKGKAIEVGSEAGNEEAGGDEIGGEGEEDEESEEESRAVGHRFSRDEEEQVERFGVEVRLGANGIAKKYGRKMRDILFRAGLGMRLSRRDNPFCQFKTWYAQHNTKPPGMSFVEYGQVITKAYNELMEGLPVDDKIGRHERMEPILTDLDDLKSRAGDHLKSDLSMFKADVKQLSDVATTMTLGRPHTQIVGCLIYTGPDQAAQRLSGMFSSSDIARLLIDKNSVRVQRVVDIITNKFRAFMDDLEMDDDADMEEDGKEHGECRARERFRGVVQAKILNDIHSCWNTNAKKPSKNKLSWKLVLNNLFNGGLVLFNWPLILGEPGASFSVNKVSGETWRKVAQPIIDGSEDQLKVSRLDTGLNCTPADAEYGEIALVIAMDGRVLCRMSDCPAYLKSLPQPTTVYKRRSATTSGVTEDRPVRPLPSRTQASASSPNPRPTKRPRDEQWEEEEDMGAGRAFIDEFGIIDNDPEPLIKPQYLYTIPPEDDEGMDDAHARDEMQAYRRFGRDMRETMHEWNMYDGSDADGGGGYVIPPLQQGRRHLAPATLRDLTQRDLPPPSTRGLRVGPSHLAHAINRAGGKSRDLHAVEMDGVRGGSSRPEVQRLPHGARRAPMPGYSHLPQGKPVVRYLPAARPSRQFSRPTTRNASPGPSRPPSRR